MILVTGSTGTIGSELVKLLSARGIKFRAFVRNSKKAAAMNIRNMEIFEGDLDDTKALDKAMKGVTRVFLLSSADPRQVELQCNVVKAAAKAGVSLIVKQSAFGSSVNSPVALARWHWQTEDDIRNSGVPYTFLRPMMFMQTLLMFTHDIVADGVLRVPMKDAKVALIDARDIALCAAEILTGKGHEGKIYELTGPKGIGFDEIAKTLSGVVGRHVSYQNITLDEAKRKMTLDGLPEWLSSDLGKLWEIFSSGRAAKATTDVADITGETPRSFDTFCHDYSEVLLGELVHH